MGPVRLLLPAGGKTMCKQHPMLVLVPVQYGVWIWTTRPQALCATTAAPSTKPRLRFRQGCGTVGVPYQLRVKRRGEK